jgi:hypothetical protein
MPDEKTTQTEAKCPFHHANGVGTSNRDWWPEQLNLGILHQHSSLSNPMGEELEWLGDQFDPGPLRSPKDQRGTPCFRNLARSSGTRYRGHTDVGLRLLESSNRVKIYRV